MKKLILILACWLLTSVTVFSQCFVSATIQSAPCDSTCSGVFTITANGGALPLSISINGMPLGQFTTFFQMGNMCPGAYDFLITDANGDTCSGLTTLIFPSSPKPNTIVSVLNATCPTCNDGAATATTVSGMAPYAYQWSNGANTPNIQNLTPGIYYLYTTDANGCTDIDTVLVGVGASGFYSLSGVCYLDQNQNGIKDIGEVVLAGQSVNVTPGGVSAITDQNGEYVVVVYPSTWDITYQANSNWNVTSLPTTYSVNLTGASIPNLDFGLYPTSTAGSGYVVAYSGWPRCFWNVSYIPTFKNDGFTTLNGSLTFTHDPSQIFVSSSITPDLISGNSYTFNITNLPPGGQISPVISLTEPAGGTLVNSTTTATVSDIYGFLGNYTYNFPQQITCSYDPNDKNVEPAGVGAPHFVEMESWLNYQIRFQNTGTDTAFTVVIVDTLDAALDRNTFSITGHSHPVDVTYTTSGEVTFRFNNILLPDSNVNEPGSHGYVSYRIKGLATNPDPTEVNNTAYIYFDLNSPIVTNTTLTTLSDNFLGLSDSFNENNLFSLYPNPSSKGALLKYQGEDVQNIYVEVLDLTGRVVSEKKQMNSGRLYLSTDLLMSGVYMIRITGKSINYLQMVVE
ncbi:MAG: T9SS type A sorting domain-containing protein [Bacteroidetes bacterium]|nr:T9SS type A sorting domain-containing protein [Bacteroidota bacterium]